MADIVGDLEGALDGMSTAQRKATLLQLGFSDKSVSALQALLGSSDALREYQKEAEKAGDITQEVASKQLESFSAQLSLLKSAVQDVFITIGSILVPVLLKLAKFLMSDVLPAVEDFIKGFRGGFKHMGDDAEGFIGKGQRMGKAIREFIDGARPRVEKFLSLFVGGLKSLREAFQFVADQIGSKATIIIAALVAIGVAVWLAFGPAGVAILAIIGLIVLLGLLRENWDEIKAKITQVIDDIIAKIEGVPVIGQIFKATVQVITDKIAALEGVIRGLIAFVQEFVTFVSAIFRGDWAAAWDSLKKLAVISLNLLLNFLKLSFFGTFKSIMASIVPWDWVRDAFNAAKDGMVGAFNDAVTGIKNLASSFYSAGADLAFSIANGIKAGINYAIYILEKGINTIIGAWNSLEFGMNAVKVAGKTVVPGFNVGTPNIPLVSLPRLDQGGRILKTGVAVVDRGDTVFGPGQAGGDIYVTVAINTPFNLTSPHDIRKAGQVLASEIRRELRTA
jgi:hypothetical protein